MKSSKKHWLAVVMFVILMVILEIVLECPAFGATVIYSDGNGTRKAEHFDMHEEDYVELSLDYDAGEVKLVNVSPKGRTGTWYHFVYDLGDTPDVDIWLTEEEGQEMLEYLERMFGYQTW